MSEVVRAQQYYEYRAFGMNRQSPRSFIRQMTALRNFKGDKYFPLIDPSEASFTGGSNDEILGPLHNMALAKLSPDARHQEIQGLGHMINIELPQAFDKEFSL